MTQSQIARLFDEGKGKPERGIFSSLFSAYSIFLRSANMLPRPYLNLQKLLCRHPLGRSLNPKSLIPAKPLANLSNQCSPNCKLDKPRLVYISTRMNFATRFTFSQDFRSYSVDRDKEVDTINLKFAEAREEIESAMESKETVYFNEEAECARAAVAEVLELYEGLLGKLPESERSAIQRAMGLKIEQLKAELQQLDE